MKRVIKGFTLIEIIVVLAVFMILMTAVFSLLEPMKRVYENVYNYSDSSAIADNASRYIEDQIRYANRLYVYAGIDFENSDAGAASEQAFLDSQVQQLRRNFLFENDLSGAERVSGASDEDVVNVIKISNPDSVNDFDSRGKISHWTYASGSSTAVKDKDWAVSQALYDDEAHRQYYSFWFSSALTGTTDSDIEDDEGNVIGQRRDYSFSPTSFTMNMSVFRNSKDRNTNAFIGTLTEPVNNQTVSFSLPNIANTGSIKTESIKYYQLKKQKVPGTDEDLLDAEGNPIFLPGQYELDSEGLKKIYNRDEFRYLYQDADALGMASGTDIYFVYTRVPRIEDYS